MENNIELKTDMQALSARDIQLRVNLIQEIMQKIMKEGEHYGTIPGCPKPSLFKAGAEKIASAFQISVFSEVEDLSTHEEKRYRITCTAYASNGVKLGSSVGECSSLEEKYKWRKPVCEGEWESADFDRRREKWLKDGSKIKQVRTEPSDQANTILQMADKRAYVAVVRKVTSASDCFTQDIEDMDAPVEYPQEKMNVAMPKPKQEKPAQEPEPPKEDGDFKLMKSKFQGYCRACGNPVVVGAEIYFSKLNGVYHKACK